MATPLWHRSRLRLGARRLRIYVIAALLLVLSVGLLPQYTPQADAQGLGRPDSRNPVDPVAGENAKAKSRPANPAEKAEAEPAADTQWPVPGTRVLKVSGEGDRAGSTAAETTFPVTLGTTRAQGTARAAEATAPAASVEVSVLSREKSEAAGLKGVLLALDRIDAGRASGASVRTTLDYAGFAHAYGGSFGSRLRLVRLPACALTDPADTACTTPEDLGGTNDMERQTISADVPLGTGRTVLAATAGEGSDQGSFGATPLSPAAEWSVADSSGAFNWSYPLRTPPVPSGLSPALGLGYNSQTVDGQTATTNGQGSWAGLGFSYEPGFVERRYKGCADDGHAKTNGDQCWAYDNATLQIAGGPSGELIKDDATGKWRISADSNAKVEKKTGAPNGDDNGEYWVLTTDDGTEYYFGLDNLPGWASGDTQTASTWTVPVYGDDAGEPCYDATLANAHCLQAWRWNLDYVKDPRGNVMSFYYAKETNHYTQGLKTEEIGKPYTRGGYLKRIDYGQRDGQVYASDAPARVVLDVAERCTGAAADCEPGDLGDGTANRWPDVPWDLNCKADTKCVGQNSPTFWTRKKLTQVTTQIRAGTGYADVDSWKLTHLFTDNGDSSASLWLNEIEHTGHAGSGTGVSMPSVKLVGQQLPNRVDVPGDNIQAMNRFRLSGVVNDIGGSLDILYESRECAHDSLPGADSSTKRCFPVKWNPPGATNPITDWFHKYVVRKVVESDLTDTTAPDMVTAYDYLGAPAGGSRSRTGSPIRSIAPGATGAVTEECASPHPTARSRARRHAPSTSICAAWADRSPTPKEWRTPTRTSSRGRSWRRSRTTAATPPTRSLPRASPPTGRTTLPPAPRTGAPPGPGTSGPQRRPTTPSWRTGPGARPALQCATTRRPGG